MYKQANRVAMGSSLGPTLANIFVVYSENKFFAYVKKPLFYTRYISYVQIRSPSRKIFTTLNFLHSAVKVTKEKEANQMLPFLDVKIEKDSR